MVESIFLTDARRKALNDYDPEDSNHRVHKSRVKNRASQALEELMWVAGNGAIENTDVFEEEKVKALLTTLLQGTGGIVPDDETDLPDEATVSKPDPDYRNSLYVAIENAQLYVERNAEPTDIYEMYGERAEQLRDDE